MQYTSVREDVNRKSKARAAALFPTLAYEETRKVFLLDDRHLGFGFICMPLQAADEGTAEKLNVLLNQDWPTDSFLQVSLWASPDIANQLNGVMALRLENKNPLLREAMRRRVEFLQRSTEEPVERRNHTRVRDIQLVITAKIPISGPMPTDAEMKTVRRLRAETEQGLKTADLFPVSLDAPRYVRLMQTILNWGKDAGWKSTPPGREYDPNTLLREQLLDYDTDIRIEKDRIRLGEKHVRSLSIKRFPQKTIFGAAMRYLGDFMTGTRGIRENCLFTASIHFPDHESQRSKLEHNRQMVTYQAYGPMLKWVPKLAAKKKSFDTLFDAIEDGDRIVRVYLNFTVFADSEDEATAAVSNMKSFFREMGFQLMEDRFINAPLFLCSLPFGADKDAIRDLFRFRTMASRHVVRLLPIFADWKGTGTPMMQFVSRNGQIMNVSLWDSGSNYNTCICAQSGSGKSFLTNDIITSYLSVGGMVRVIDVGRSYEKTADALGGEFLVFDRDSDICLNPFDIIKDYEEEADVLAGIVAAMAAPTEKLTDLQTSNLKRYLKTCWDEHGTNLTVDILADALCSDKDQRVRDLGLQLFPFTERGEYGRYVNGKNNVNLNNSFAVLELEELKGRRHLQKVVLLMLIYSIQQEMYLGERDRPKLVFIDEAWDLLGEGDTAKFMETGFRRFRKYGGAGIVITQSVQDLYKNDTGIAIVENSANMYLLGQKAQTVEAIKEAKRLPLSDGGYRLLKTVHTIPGSYSEIFFLTEGGAGIGRLIVDRFTQLLYTTKADEVNAIKQLRAQGMPLEEAINRIIAQEEGRRYDAEEKGSCAA